MAPSTRTAGTAGRASTAGTARTGRLECDAWAAYYRREWGPFLRAAVGMVEAGFGMGPRRTLLGAWYVLRANQVWAPYPDNDPVAARAFMRRFYTLVASQGHPNLDPTCAAELEVNWWRVHRLHQHSTDLSERDLTAALIALYAYVYQAPPESVRAASELRVAAMDASDRWVAAGCSLADPLLASERRLLVASYTALRDAVDRNPS